MSKCDRGAIFAGGLVVGVAIALIFLVWAFPWFSDPTQSASYCQADDRVCAEQYQNPNDPHFWVLPFYGWFYAEDSLAQWLMALFGVLATFASLYAVFLLPDTLKETRFANSNAASGVEAARLSIREQQKTSRHELRAYVCVNSVELLETDRTGFKARIIFANFGQTPAHDLRIRCREITIKPDAITADLIDLRGVDPTESAVIGPTAGCSKTIDNVLEEDELTAIQKEDYVIWIYGDVKYQDVFGDSWVTNFCLRVWRLGQPTERIGPCEFGNTAT